LTIVKLKWKLDGSLDSSFSCDFLRGFGAQNEDLAKLISPENNLFDYMNAQLAKTLDQNGNIVEKLLRWQISSS